ncbi:MAG: SRPBCC family protein [Actinobacteria bacterium]|nr:SRPBCC family protein [Actinomycetota bacterium]MBI3686531.1 SRPBCC family protein [Actinomycetota bacterium]
MSTTTNRTVTTQVYRIYIKATPQAVWDAITQPEWTERYGYGVRSEFDLRPGGAYRGLTSEAMRAMGAPEVAVEGEIIEADPPRKLVQKWHMVMDPEVAAEGATVLTYEIETSGDGVTRLTLIHDIEGAPRLALLVSGEMEGMGAGGGWSWVLSDLKSLLETGTSFTNGGGPQG